MSTNQVPNSQNPVADTPPPVTTLTPEQVVEQLRTVRTQIVEVTPLTPKQKRTLSKQAHLSNAVVQASINAIGASDNISQAVGQPSEDVRQLVDESNRWTAVEDELKTTLNGVAGGNLVRRQRIAFIAGVAYNLASRLARDPAHAGLVQHVQEIKRLKSFTRRKKAQTAPKPTSPAPQAPAPAGSQQHGVSPEHGASVMETS